MVGLEKVILLFGSKTVYFRWVAKPRNGAIVIPLDGKPSN
jgi:hypothetical protein